jgi:hypothetical protein
MIDNKKYGVKLSIISTLDYKDFTEIALAIRNLGYTLTMVDNGNVVCEKIEDGVLAKK